MDASEEKIARDKAAIDAMKNAKVNMGAALDRVAVLERTLSSAISSLRQAEENISPKVYCYQTDGQKNRTVHESIEAQIAEYSKVL
jgi:hypothetical protein